jgi:hypothetical protein
VERGPRGRAGGAEAARRARRPAHSVADRRLADWHAGHARAAEAVLGVRRLPAHVLIETVSVLTRLRSGILSPVADGAGRPGLTTRKGERDRRVSRLRPLDEST